MFDHQEIGRVFVLARRAGQLAGLPEVAGGAFRPGGVGARLQFVPIRLLGELLGAGKQRHHASLQQVVVAPPEQEGPVNLIRAVAQHVLRRQARLQRRQESVLAVGEVNQDTSRNP